MSSPNFQYPISELETLAHFGSWEYNFDKNTLFVSKGFSDIFGIKNLAQPVNIKDFISFFPKVELKRILHLIRKQIQQNKAFEGEIELINANQKEIIVLVKMQLLYNEKDILTDLKGIAVDITATKLNEKAEILLKNGSDAIIIINQYCKIIYVSPTCSEILNKSTQEIRGLNPLTLVHPDDHRKLLHTFYTAEKNKGKKTKDIIIRIQLNEEYTKIIEIEFNNQQDNNSIKGTIINFRDVTSKENAIASLKLMESAVKNTTEAVIIAEAEPSNHKGPKVIFVNNAFCEMSGYTKDEIIGKSPKILQGPNSDKNAIKNLGLAIKKWEKHKTTLLNYKKNGEPYWVSFNLSPIKNDDGIFTHWVAIEREITEVKKIELERELYINISRLFISKHNIKELLTDSLQIILHLTQSLIGEIWLLSPDKNYISLVSHAQQEERLEGYYKETTFFTKTKKSEGIPGITWHNKKIEFWKDVTNNPNFIRRESARKYGIENAITLPLINGDLVIGVVLLGYSKYFNFKTISESLLYRIFSHLSTELIRKQLELQLENIFNSPLDIIMIAGRDGIIKKVNPAVKQILEYETNEIENLPFSNFIHPEDLAASFYEAEKMLSGSTIPNFENRIITKNGNIKWIVWSFIPSIEDNLVYGMGKDVTEKKTLEALLTKANKLSKIGSWDLNLIENSIYLSDICKNIIELPADINPTVNNGIVKFKEGEQKKIIQQKIDECIQTGRGWDEEILMETFNGNLKWVRSIGEGEFLNEKCIRVYGSIQDIHERKKAEQEIISNNERFNLVTKATNDLIWEWDIIFNKRYRLGSPFFERLGYTSEEIKNLSNWIEYIHPEDVDRVENKRIHIFENTKETYWEDQYRFKKADGTYAYVYDRGYIVRLSNNKVIKLIGSTQNISKLKQKENELEELNEKLIKKANEVLQSEKRYSELFHLSPLPMWVYDLETLSFLEVNKAAIDHYGYTENEFLSMTLREIRPKEEIHYLEKQIEITKNKNKDYATGTYKHQKKSGEIINVEVQSNYISFQGKNARLVLINDITERLEYINKVESKNQELQQIAWLQSHVMRAPVAKILGIIQIAQSINLNDEEKKTLQNDLLASVKELDTVIHDIANKTHHARLK